MKKLLLLTILLLCAGRAMAQTTVNISVTDTPDSQTWNNGTYKSELLSPSGTNPNGPFNIINGGGSLVIQTGNLSGTGTASILLPANVNIAPAGTQWKVTVCPQATSACFFQLVTVGTSSPQTLAMTPPSIRINMQTTPPPITAYTTGELTGTAIGSLAYILTLPGYETCQVVSGNSCTIWAPIGSGGGSGIPGAPVNSPQCNNASISFKACTNNPAIMYVSTSGNDANDGKSWDTAKLTIMAAVCALPTGSCAASPKQAGAGTVEFTDGVTCNSVAAAGCWIAGPGDSQYPNMTSSTSGPTAWTIELNNPYPAINFICATGQAGAPTGNRPTCNVMGPNHTQGNGNLPIFWATGNTLGSFYIYGMSGGQFGGGQFSSSWGRIGIDSATGQIINPTTTQTPSFTIENVNTGNISGAGAVGVGPQFAIGNGFHMHFRDITVTGNNAEGCNTAAISRTSNVVTLTTANCDNIPASTQCPFLVGDHLSLRDTGADGTFNGTFTATSACGATNTVTFNQTGPNFSGSINTAGVVSSDRAFGITCYLCAVTELRQIAFNGNGMKLYTGPSTTFQMNDVYTEGGGALTTPQLWISPLLGGGGGQVDISNFNMADTPLVPSVINEGGPLMFVHTEQSTSTNIRGPMIVLGGNDESFRTTGILNNGQSGWYNNTKFEADTDIARRKDAVTTNLFTNMAVQNPASWGGSNFTTVSGKPDPFGGTGAIEIDATATTNVFFYQLLTSVNVNDTIVFGAWVRELSPVANATPIAMNLTGGAIGATCYGNLGQIAPPTQFVGDGNWYWLTGSCRIWINTPTPTIQFFAGVSPTSEIQIYRPFIYKVPAGTVSGTELTDEINSLGFGPSTQAGAGDVVFPADKKLCMPSGSATDEFCGYFTHSDTANRTYTLPDVSGNVCLTTSCASFGNPDSVFDNFNRSSLNTSGPCPSGSCWSTFGGSTLPSITGNQISFAPGGAGSVGATLNYPTTNFGPYEFSQFTVTGDLSQTAYYAYTNISGVSGANYYACLSASGFTNFTRILRSGVIEAQGTFSLADTDVFRCETVPVPTGTQINLKRCISGVVGPNCTTELTFTDTTPLPTGLPGLALQTFTGGVTSSLDNFSGGALNSSFAALDVEQVWVQPQHFGSMTVGAYSPVSTNYTDGAIFSSLWLPNLSLCTDSTGKAVTTGCSGNISGLTTGQVAIAGSALTITSSKALQGTDANVLSSGTVSGTAATLCTDANGGATTAGCTGGSISGLATGQVPIAGSASSLTSSKALQGTDSNILTSSTIAAGAGNLLCTDTGSGATTSGCAVFNTQSAATNTNIAATNMVASTSALHSYLFQWTISLTAVGTSCTSSTTINMNAIFTDPNVSTTTTELLGQITIAAGGNGTVGFVAQGTDNILAKTGTAVQYSTSGYTAGTGCTVNPTYQVSPTLVQLW